MNNGNPIPQDQRWQALLTRSTPTFVGDTTLPFGFLTQTLARIKSESREREIFERIGLRSLFVAISVLIAIVGVSISVQLQSRSDFDPAVKSLLQADDVPIS